MTDIILETERLILRHVDPDKDFEAMADCYSDPETMKYIGGETMNRAQAWRSMAMMMGHQQMRGFCFMSCIEKATGEWVGRVGPWAPEGWPAPEVGWTIHRNHWRKGFAKEAGRACIDYAFDTLGWDKVIHVIQDGNIGSMKTAEALGSKRLYSMDGIPEVTDEFCWIYGQDKPL
ncbi:GNAT family N-acetyltransferase [Litorimonas sp. RW-G-Af-16]|uniref:GNAT family N-acetyltransferase n=1 Tax=Litorimonas sp. RW-G-Af-16 TaxID=3241168 RepID=UPI00390CD7A0